MAALDALAEIGDPAARTALESVSVTAPAGERERPAARLRPSDSGNNIPYLSGAPKNAFKFYVDGKEIILITDNVKIVKTEDLIAYTTIKKYDGTDLELSGSEISFTQGANRVWISNNTDPVMSLDASGDSLDASRDSLAGCTGSHLAGDLN